LKKSSCATLVELDAEEVAVEVNFIRGVPKVNIVGLPSGEIQESKERVKSALISSGFVFPNKIITINLSPSDIRKGGSHFDLSIALTIALFEYDEVQLSNWFVFGELGLDGTLKDTKAIFPIILSLVQNKKVDRVLVPKDSLEKISTIPNIEVFGVETLSDAIDFFRGILNIEPAEKREIDFENIDIGGEKFFYSKSFESDFKDILGQVVAKRASLIAVSGMHNIILEGSPGSGKSMTAKRLQYILPPLKNSEILEIAKFESLEGLEPKFKPIRPFRSPHHTASRGSIFGGGSRVAKVGEVSMANSGILFFDELPHFTKQILEALREPLQDYSILISRVQNKIKYPANFLFVGAMNPCPCGYLMSKNHNCRCSELEIKRYRNSLSEPFWDRIDLYVSMSEVSIDDKPTTTSKEMYKQVLKAFRMQIERGQKSFNGRLNEREIDIFIKISDEALETLRKASAKFNLSLRAISKIKRVARTIADLDGSPQITKLHVLEAISFRKR
jgi:magnesium chelatase family protein